MPLKKLLPLVLVLISFLSAPAQTSECVQTLNQATDEFNAGHFYGIPSLLKSCLEKGGYTKEQQVHAYLLLCQAYLIIDDPIAAEDSYLKLLRADPEYIADDIKDPVDVVFLSKKFTSTPVFTPRLRLGANTSFYRNISEVSTGANQKNESVKHFLKPGYQLGLGLDYNINDNFSLGVDGILSYKAFGSTHSNFIDSHTLTVSEKQFWLDIPLTLKYAIHKGKIRPFLYAGAAANFLINSRGTFVYVSKTSGSTETTTTGPDVGVTYMRKSFNRSLVMGGGVNYKIGKDYLFVDVRFMAGLNNMANNPFASDPTAAGNPNWIPVLSELSTLYGYADSKFRLDNLSISVGYIRPLYNPRKIKRARGVGSVSRDIKRQSKDEKK